MATFTRTATLVTDPDTFARILEMADAAAVAFTLTADNLQVRAAQDADRAKMRAASMAAGKARAKAQRAAAKAAKAECATVTIEWLDELELAVRNLGC